MAGFTGLSLTLGASGMTLAQRKLAVSMSAVVLGSGIWSMHFVGMLGLQLLITPGTCAYGDTASQRLFANGFMLDAASIAWFFDHYLAHAHRRDCRFAPLEHDDLHGVAPACVILAEYDPLVDEGLAYADKLRLAGVPVMLELYRGLTHDFIKMGRSLDEAGDAQEAAAAALRGAWPP